MIDTEDHGTIVIDGQLLWGVPDDRADATIYMNLEGRAQLTKALISGAPSIKVYGPSGDVYSLHFRSIEGEYLDEVENQ